MPARPNPDPAPAGPPESPELRGDFKVGDVSGVGNAVGHGASAEVTTVNATGDHPTFINEQHIHQASVPASLNPLHSLRAPVADFTGRTKELTAIVAAAERGASISGLRGMGGVGKTELALAAARQLAARFPDAQILVELRGTPRPGTADKPLSAAEALAAVIHSFAPDAKLPDDPAALQQIYLSLLHNKRALILADNAADAAQVKPLLPPAGCLLLVTSRQHFAIPGLTAIDLDCLPEKHAVKLLKRICKRIGNDAAALARACGRLPLALRLAASALAARDTLAVADYLARLADTTKRLAVLEQYREQTAEQLGVAASLASSYDLLDANLQSRWRMLSVFPATFDAAAAGAVWSLPADVVQASSLQSDSRLEARTPTSAGEAAAETLGDLRRYSLVEWDAKTQRFSLHDLARDFAQSALPPAERLPAAERHAEHYCDLLATAKNLYKKGHENILAGLSLFDRERANIEAGQSWAAAHANSGDAAAHLTKDYPNAGVYVLDLRLQPRQWIDWLNAGRAAARRLKDRAAESAHVGNLGVAYKSLGDACKAIKFYEQALVIAREIGDRRGEGNVLGNLGTAHAHMGDARKAIEFYEQALPIRREIGDRRGEGTDLGNLGNAYLNLGDSRKAIEFYERHRTIAREIGDRRGECRHLVNLGLARAALGDARKAIECYEQALVIAREIGDRQGEANASWNLGLALVKRGDRDRGLALMQVRVHYLRELGHPDAAKDAARVEALRRQPSSAPDDRWAGP